MEISSTNRDRASRTVVFGRILNLSDKALAREAYRYFNEQPGDFDNPDNNVGGFGSTYGYRVQRYPGGVAKVTIYTD